MRAPLWVWLGVVTNVALWVATVSLSPRVSDDPMFAKGDVVRIAGGVSDCFDCPRYILLGRAIGSPVSPSWVPVRLINAPAIWFSAGRDIGLGIRQLSARRLLFAFLFQWVLVGGGAIYWRSKAARLRSQ
jgi:hypothetical protein